MTNRLNELREKAGLTPMGNKTNRDKDDDSEDSFDAQKYTHNYDSEGGFHLQDRVEEIGLKRELCLRRDEESVYWEV